MRINKLTIAAAASVLSLSAPANALEILIFNGGGHAVGTAAYKSFEVAASYWESLLTDDVRVNISVRYGNVAQGVTAVSGATTVLVTVDTVYAALAADGTSAVDASAVSNLQSLGQSTDAEFAGSGSLTVLANGLSASGRSYVDETTRVDNDGSRNNTVLQVNNANAEALGITTNYAGDIIDDTIQSSSVSFSRTLKFDFDPTDGIDAGSYDYTGIAIREIGVALGLDSNLQSYDFRTSPYAQRENGTVETSAVSKVLDLFRYSDSDKVDWSTSSTDKYFSIDGGDTQVLGGSQVGKGAYNGDGVFANNWLDDEDGNSMGSAIGASRPARTCR